MSDSDYLALFFAIIKPNIVYWILKVEKTLFNVREWLGNI